MPARKTTGGNTLVIANPTNKKISEENYIPAVKTRAHFVIVTGRDGSRLMISSWGKEYYIDIREYRRYVKRHSSYLVSNVIDID